MRSISWTVVAVLAAFSCRPAAQPSLPSSGPAAQTWTRGAVCYEIFVRSFADSDSNGVGDFNGLTARLDYVNDGNPETRKDLGASCIWLMPVAESPSYHGYDVADYYALDREYGTVEDFKRFVAEAHRRGIKVLVDMVLNHASSEHPSFKTALADTTSPYRAWYRFSPAPLGKGPWGMDAWHKSPVRDEYYYGVFWSGMPDLNYESPAVREEAKKVATFWLRQMGVDGFRLDAIPYLTEEGSCLSGCPGTHAYLREYAAHIDSVAPGAYTVGEAWGKVDTVLPYYPDQLTSYFAFELADSLVSGVRHGSAAHILRGYLRLQDTLPPYRWSPLLSNHDGARVMTMLGRDMAKARLAATLLLTLPGLPFVYYGEEIGMTGDKPDPRLRTPMQWRPGHGTGFTTGTPWQNAQPDSQTTTVEAQDPDSGSLLNLYRNLIHLRKSNDALAVGRLVPLTTGSAAVTAYLRREGDLAVLVVANLGDAPAAGLVLSAAAGVLPRGSYQARNLLGGPDGAELEVGADGSVQGYQPVSGPLASRASMVLELVRH
jgi:glycosidase